MEFLKPYRQYQSTETALLKVYNDILEAIVNRSYVMLVCTVGRLTVGSLISILDINLVTSMEQLQNLILLHLECLQDPSSVPLPFVPSAENMVLIIISQPYITHAITVSYLICNNLLPTMQYNT